MSLIEGIGDEVTILVTVIVAVTTIVAAWFSTSVQEQQSSWQDGDPGSVVDPGSLVDPDPPSHVSTNSEDGGSTTVSDPVSTNQENFPRRTGEEHSPYTEPCDVPAASRNASNTGEGDVVEDIVPGCLNKSTDDPGLERGGEATMLASTSQSSSFECIDATNTEVDASESSSSKSTDCATGSDSTDGASSVDGRPKDIVQERVEDVQIQGEEQFVRRRNVPSTEASLSNSSERTLGAVRVSPDVSDQSKATSHVGAERISQSEGVSHSDNTPSNQPQRTRDQIASGVITIKLRFLDDTERLVSTNMDDTLGNFRRETFATELQSGQMVRFISNGQLLSDDSRTLASYGITNQHVIHCQISRSAARPAQGRNQPEAREGDFDVGRYMVPLFALILALVWYLRFQYRYMFNATSTLSLTAVSAVFVLALLAVWRS